MARPFVVVVVVVGISACWRGPAPAPAPAAATAPAPAAAQPAPRAPADRPCATGDEFDPQNPACRDTCFWSAPAGWPGCERALADLLGRGYTCTTRSPWSCTPPPTVALPPASSAPVSPPPAVCTPGSCAAVTARIIALRFEGPVMRVTIGAGQHQGIAPTWKATLLDDTGAAVAGGTVRIVRVTRFRTEGELPGWTPSQLHALKIPMVRLEP